MKHLSKLFAVVALFIGLSSQAQDTNNPWAISFGANAVDTRFSAAQKFEDQFSNFFNAKDNWNILPSVSYLNVSRYIGSGFSFGVTGSVNRIDKFVNKVPGTYTTFETTNPGDLMYYGIDATPPSSYYSALQQISTT